MKKWLDRLSSLKSGALLAVLAAACLLGALALPGVENASMTDEEKRLSAVLSAISGAGETRVSVFYEGDASAWSGASRRAIGAVIVSEGARLVSVKIDLLLAAKALLGLPLEANEVFLLEERVR